MKHSFALCLCYLSVLPMLGCETPSSHARELPASESVVSPAVGTARLQPVASHLSLTGTLKAHRESAVAADATGKILSVNVERGSSVAQGQVLVQIDRRQARLAAAEAGTSVAAARTRSTLAQTECARAQRLFDSRVISQADYDVTRAQCDDAALAVESAGVRSELAHKALGDLAIRAPFAGVVAERLVSPGEYVRPDTRVATLVQLDPIARPAAALQPLDQLRRQLDHPIQPEALRIFARKLARQQRDCPRAARAATAPATPPRRCDNTGPPGSGRP